MSSKIPAILVGFAVALAGCTPPPQTSQQVPEPATNTSSAVASDNAIAPDAAEQAVYAPYREGIIGNGQTSVLFFHATWCGECKRDDKALTEWYENNEIEISTYKVDYDTATDLKSRYGIVQQNTYVVIDGEGNAVKTVSFPGVDTLRELLTSAAQ